jgi:hypothetical protein
VRQIKSETDELRAINVELVTTVSNLEQTKRDDNEIIASLKTDVSKQEGFRKLRIVFRSTIKHCNLSK